MAVTGVGNYNSNYEDIYASSRKEAVKKERTKETAAAQRSTETAKTSSNEEYLKSLQKRVPYMKLQIAYGVNTKNDGKVDVLDINPKLLEKMQNDPKAAKEYTQRLKDVESAHKYVDNFLKATGSTVICSHAYLDENGNYSNFTVSVRKDKLNERLRKEAQENAEERIEKSRENAHENAEQLAEKMEGYYMPVSLNSSFTTYASSLEGTSRKKSSKVLSSKAGNSNIVTNLSANSNKNENGSIEGVRANSETGSSRAGNKVVTRDSEIFYNDYLLKTSNDKSYVIDGVEFSAEGIDAVRSVVQNAVSPLGGKFYYDYKDYAQMGIAENSVAKYAAENLTEEQTRVVNQSLSGYISSLLDKEEEWINSECYIDGTEGVGDTGEMNTYYGVRQSIPQWMRDELDAALDKFNNYGQGSSSKAVSGNHSAEGRNGSLIYCASNKDLAGGIRSLFAGTDITDASQLADTFKEYKDMMTAAYRAVGFGRTTNDMLRDDINSFTKQISNMKAVFSGINRNGVNYDILV